MHRSYVVIILDSLHRAAEAVFPYALVLLVLIVLGMAWFVILSALAMIGDLL